MTASDIVTDNFLLLIKDSYWQLNVKTVEALRFRTIKTIAKATYSINKDKEDL